MAARRRAQDRDFNRRRRLILDKGFELARNQLDTGLGRCLLLGNVQEEDRLGDRKRLLERQSAFECRHLDAGLRRFVVLRERAPHQPAVLCERQPAATAFGDRLDLARPRYMRRLESQRPATPGFVTHSLFRPETRRCLNFWESALPSEVRFRAALSPTPVLTADEFPELHRAWRRQDAARQRCLSPPSAAVRRSRTRARPPQSAPVPEATARSASECDAEEVFVTRMATLKSPPPPREHVETVCRDAASIAVLQEVVRARSR